VCVCVFYGMSILAVSIIVYVCVRVCWSVMCHFVRRLSFVREEKTAFLRTLFAKKFREKNRKTTQALLGDVNKISTIQAFSSNSSRSIVSSRGHKGAYYGAFFAVARLWHDCGTVRNPKKNEISAWPSLVN